MRRRCCWQHRDGRAGGCGAALYCWYAYVVHHWVVHVVCLPAAIPITVVYSLPTIGSTRLSSFDSVAAVAGLHADRRRRDSRYLPYVLGILVRLRCAADIASKLYPLPGSGQPEMTHAEQATCVAIASETPSGSARWQTPGTFTQLPTGATVAATAVNYQGRQSNRIDLGGISRATDGATAGIFVTPSVLHGRSWSAAGCLQSSSGSSSWARR